MRAGATVIDSRDSRVANTTHQSKQCKHCFIHAHACRWIQYFHAAGCVI